MRAPRNDHWLLAEISCFHGRNDDEWFLLEWWGDSMGWVVSKAPIYSLYSCGSGPAVEPAPPVVEIDPADIAAVYAEPCAHPGSCPACKAAGR